MDKYLKNYKNSKFPKNKEMLMQYAKVLKNRIEITAKADAKLPLISMLHINQILFWKY